MGAVMMWVWLAIYVHPALACSGSSDELRSGAIAVIAAVAQGRCEVVL